MMAVAEEAADAATVVVDRACFPLLPTEKTKTKRRANNEVIIKYIKRRGKSKKVMIWLQSGWDLLHRTFCSKATWQESLLGCFLQIDQFILETRNALIITINSQNGQVFFKSSGGNERINIANVFVKWPESTAKISIAL